MQADAVVLSRYERNRPPPVEYSMWRPPPSLACASLRILSMKQLKWSGDKTQPCLTPSSHFAPSTIVQLLNDVYQLVRHPILFQDSNEGMPVDWAVRLGKVNKKEADVSVVLCSSLHNLPGHPDLVNCSMPFPKSTLSFHEAGVQWFLATSLTEPKPVLGRFSHDVLSVLHILQQLGSKWRVHRTMSPLEGIQGKFRTMLTVCLWLWWLDVCWPIEL